MTQTVTLAIRLHHDQAIFEGPKVPDRLARLIAMGWVADQAIQTFACLNTSNGWVKGDEKGLGAFRLDEHDVDERVERLIADFSVGMA